MPQDVKPGWFADESGAVTVDWVVLAAAVIMLGIGVVTLIGSGVTGIAVGLETTLSTATVRDLVFD